MSAIITVENLSKKYRIQHQGRESYTALRDVLAQKARNLFKPSTLNSQLSTSQEDFWALKDINFEVQQGEVLGIIGRNGAGKSTLLKILSRITEPTTGRITLRGRVASLLEVGTGFHPELTGRENIYLNGAILGMTKAEIRRKFDEIVAFAEIEKFLDTPVKRYSSGMYVRLAFAVAAHLEPEILVVDEVLAVGDAEFQKKCMGKMQHVAQTGRTVLFVSHNTNSLRSLCSTGLLLYQGKLEHQGTIDTTIRAYLTSFNRLQENKSFSVVHCRLISDEPDRVLTEFHAGDSAYLAFDFLQENNTDIIIAFTVYNSDGIGVLSSVIDDIGHPAKPGTKQVKFKLPSDMFNSGEYRVEGIVSDSNGQIIDKQESYCVFTVHRSNRFDMQGNRSAGAMRLPKSHILIQ